MLRFILGMAIVGSLAGCGSGMTAADRDFARKLVRGVAAGYETAPVVNRNNQYSFLVKGLCPHRYQDLTLKSTHLTGRGNQRVCKY